MRAQQLNFWQPRCHLLLGKISEHLDSLEIPSPIKEPHFAELLGVVTDLEERSVKLDAYWTNAWKHLLEAAKELGVPNA